MLTDFTITDADIGRTIGPRDGFLVSLTMAVAPSVYEVPDANPATQQFKSGYFTLRGSGDVRNLYNSLTGGLSPVLIQNHSLAYHGDLKVVCVPRGSTWSITLSDVALSKQERNELGKTEAQKALEAHWRRLEAARSAAPQPHGTARRAEAILQAARAP
jgi:hypothetical protein